MKKKELKRKIKVLKLTIESYENDIYELIHNPASDTAKAIRFRWELNFMANELVWNGTAGGEGFGGILQESETKQESTAMSKEEARQIVSAYLKDNGGLIPICDTVIYRVQVQPQAFEEWTFIGLIKFIYDLK